MRQVPRWGQARLVAAAEIARDVRLLELAPASFTLPTPGSHIGVAVHIEGRPDTRSYSVVGACTDGRYRIAVKRLPESRGGSAYMHALQPGATLSISEPSNHFELLPGRPDYLLVAGGIGITPLYGMALALAERGARFRLLYGAQSREDAAFADELAARLGDRLDLVLGRPINIAAALAGLRQDGEAYVCGPLGMLEAAKQAWAASGRPVERLRFETFGASGRYATAPFTVRLPRLGRQVTVSRHQSMLEALEAAGVGVISDCRRGECGLCAVKILDADGPVDHRDVFFSEVQKAANTHLCTCVSRVAGGSVTIETADRGSALERRGTPA